MVAIAVDQSGANGFPAETPPLFRRLVEVAKTGNVLVMGHPSLRAARGLKDSRYRSSFDITSFGLHLERCAVVGADLSRYEHMHALFTRMRPTHLLLQVNDVGKLIDGRGW